MHSNLLNSGVKTLTIAIARVATLIINKFSCICEGQSWWVCIIKFLLLYIIYIFWLMKPCSISAIRNIMLSISYQQYWWLSLCDDVSLIKPGNITVIDARKWFTLNVRGPSYLGLTRSISWLLMPWLLTSPRHRQPWYLLYRICRSLSYLRKDFRNLSHINMEEWHKM